MNGAYGAAAIVGLVIPFVVSFLKDTTWNSKVKQAVAVVVSIVAAVAVSVVDNGVDLSNWQAFVTNLGIIFTVSQVFYQQYFGGTSVNASLENVGIGAGNAGNDGQV